MKLTTFSLIIIFFIAKGTTSFSQSKINKNFNQQSIDSITKSILILNERDSIKISKLNRIVSENRFNKYTLSTIKKSIEIATSTKNSVLIADEYRILGNYYYSVVSAKHF